MKLNLQNPKQSLSLAYRRQRPVRSKLDLFKTNLRKLLYKIEASKDESEEHAKADIRDFLLDTYYKGTNEINTKDRKDLVIHLGKTVADNVGVIIETKKPDSKTGMPTSEKPNCKALHELVLYYLRERLDKENIDLKYLIITDAYKWYIFEAAWFEKHFYRNAAFRKQYEEWRDKKKITDDTELFYKAIAKPFIDKIDEDATCTYFDIKNYEEALEKTGAEEDKSLVSLYKVLSPGHLLKVGFEDDSNKLDEKFYRELLHIIGLEEVKEGSKYIIRRKKENVNKGSLLENAISLLETEGYDKVTDINQYGTTHEERLFNIALELCITWINRILFLKLLEGQLVNYHNGDKEYLFLNTKMVPAYGELFTLFHKVLAVDLQKRDAPLQKKYGRVPYLNSSLFEISELESDTIKINSLDSSLELEFIGTTILKDAMKQSKHASLPALDYLFKFLNAYDFASESTEDIDEENKTLINASVLGKVFEKINGYKDGSIFTPGFITMYMCRQSIRMAVLQKFKDKYNWKVDEFDDLKNYIIDQRSKKDVLLFNELINSLHICDPAVGSGHFLVSALNEIITIKSELGILADNEGIRIQDYNVVIENDELYVTDQFGDVYSYLLYNGKPENKESQRLQKTLFHEKQTLIENCLFGVDINPNSVKICRLRLWVELLKNTYYREEGNYTDLETLPNIDINIKCGNSLVSRFPLDADLKKALKSIKYDIAAYRGFVNDYKNAKDRELKKGLEKIINTIKQDFRIEIGRYDPKYIKLQKLQYEFNLLVSPNMFREEEVDYGNKNYKKEREEKIKGLEDEINELSREVAEIKNNPIYKNALEWRFEFPEVLNNNGDFEGFDVVLGNPPYVDIKGLNPNIVDFLFATYEVTENRINLYSIFIERGKQILKSQGYFSFIIPNSILMSSSYQKIRRLIFEDVSEIIKLPDNVFKGSDVKVETAILSFQKQIKHKIVKVIKYKHDDIISSIDAGLSQNLSKSIWTDLQGLSYNIYLTDSIQEVLLKAITDTIPLEKLADFSLGITPYDKYKGHTPDLIKKRGYHSIMKLDKEYKPLISGENIQRYFIDSTVKEFIHYGNWLGASREERFFTVPRIIVRQIVSGKPPKIFAGYTDKPLFFTQIGFGIIPHSDKTNPKYITALLNSTLINFIHKFIYLDIEKELFQKILIENCRQFPIKSISLNTQKPFITLVDKILALKEQGKDTSDLEAKIDAMVYELYGLTEEEIKTVEGAK